MNRRKGEPVHDARLVDLILSDHRGSSRATSASAPGTGLASPETGRQNRRYRDLDRRQRPHVQHLNPRKCPQTAHYSSETGKHRFSSDCLVGLRELEPRAKFCHAASLARGSATAAWAPSGGRLDDKFFRAAFLWRPRRATLNPQPRWSSCRVRLRPGPRQTHHFGRSPRERVQLFAGDRIHRDLAASS
jgi:hypothetical protein